MKITAVDPLELGYRKVDPPMARNFAVVRIETDAGLVGWGEASTNWGHSYPTVFSAAVRDVVAAPLLGTDPTDVRGRLAQLHVLLDGYLGWEGMSSQVISAIEIACWDLVGQALEVPIHRLFGAANRPLRSTAPARRCSRRRLDTTPTTSTRRSSTASRGSRCGSGAAWPTTSPPSPPCVSTSARTC